MNNNSTHHGNSSDNSNHDKIQFFLLDEILIFFSRFFWEKKSTFILLFSWWWFFFGHCNRFQHREINSNESEMKSRMQFHQNHALMKYHDGIQWKLFPSSFFPWKWHHHHHQQQQSIQINCPNERWCHPFEWIKTETNWTKMKAVKKTIWIILIRT